MTAYIEPKPFTEMSLVIVESPAKCAKIQSYLGPGYTVKATMGHIRALEESLDAVGIDNNWTPKYAELSTKKDAIKALRAAAKGNKVILATDDDREGEGIAWHVCFLLKLNPANTPRIVFHEITKPAITAAVAAPRLLDLNKANAQQARAMLDLLVGFTMSRVLWSRVAPKLSAGRCQTPALRLVVERDAEVENHSATAFWRIQGQWTAVKAVTVAAITLAATAIADYATKAEALAVLEKVHTAPPSTVASVKVSVSTSAPPKPLITSTLQQEASSCHGLNPKVTMHAAQKLYEAGHITYMRTDNAAISEEAANKIRAIVTTKYGPQFVGSAGQYVLGQTEVKTVKAMKTKKTEDTKPEAPEAQAAHEAIRPTHPEVEMPDLDDSNQKTVYRLVWRRAFQSQMAPSLTDVRKATVVIDADAGTQYAAEQTKVNFAGYRALDIVDPAKTAAEQTAWDTWTPLLTTGASLLWTALQADEHFTKPKGRYTEASLIAELEKRGIGRPSTFASLVGTILDRDYVEKTNVEGATQTSQHYALAPRVWPPASKTESHKVGAEKNKMRSTPLGRSVTDFLNREYNDLFNYEFTAAMEGDLDDIAKGTKPWKSLLQTTWDTYKDRYNATISAPSTVAKSARERVLDGGIKVIQSRKGPLFIKEVDGEKTKFASLPSGKTFDTATLEDAVAAYTTVTNTGELLGSHDGADIHKKKGPYGFYIAWKAIKIPAKAEESLEATIERLTEKSKVDPATAYNRVVGEFTIKRGPYGLYFYKQALKKANFVKLPGNEPDKMTEADLKLLYADGAKKSKDKKKTKMTEAS